MKRAYQKPTLEVESFAITQQITSCSGVKIGFNSSQCIISDPDAQKYEYLLTLANSGYFADTVGCKQVFDFGGNLGDGICYHTSVTPAFTS